VFGTVLDQLLEQSRQLVLVVKLGHPLNTTKRLVLVLPGAIDHNPGFWGALTTAKTLAAELGAGILGLVVGGVAERYGQLCDGIKPQVPSSWEAIPRWGMLLPELRGRLRPDDLVVVMSARRGTLAWHSRLERLPGQLARLVPESFIIMYPSQIQPAAVESGSGSIVPRALGPERVVADLGAPSFESAVRTLLATTFAGEPGMLERVSETLVRSQRDRSTEILPGVVVPHARVRGLAEPLLFLGASREGVRFPHTSEPARLIFLLLSPEERPAEHLEQLAEIARLVGSPRRVAELLECRSAEDLIASLGEQHARV
jgi:mannitol/fructose-specific phosphotransferase system IIA component (Ntr-type)